jgi:hypothetical protein
MKQQEIDKDIDLKILHIKNIKKVINTGSEEPEIFMSLLLYKIIKKWGLHSLPLRILHDLDISLEMEMNRYGLKEND